MQANKDVYSSLISFHFTAVPGGCSDFGGGHNWLLLLLSGQVISCRTYIVCIESNVYCFWVVQKFHFMYIVDQRAYNVTYLHAKQGKVILKVQLHSREDSCSIKIL